MTDPHRALGPQHTSTRREKGISVSTHAGAMDADNHLMTTAGTVGTLDLDRDLPCRQNPADLWFAELPEEVEAAKALCADCPIRAMCLDQALERREPWGVWGGQLVLQGVVVPRKRPRGRPRKNPVAA